MTDLHFTIEIDGALHRYGPHDLLPNSLASGRVSAITLNLDVAPSGLSDAAARPQTFPIAMIACDNETYCLDEALVFIAEDADVTPAKLAWLMELSLFQYDEDSDCDSWDTQHMRFVDDARDLANALLLSEEAALLERLRDQLRDRIAWIVPRGMRLHAEIANDQIKLSLIDATAA